MSSLLKLPPNELKKRLDEISTPGKGTGEIAVQEKRLLEATVKDHKTRS